MTGDSNSTNSNGKFVAVGNEEEDFMSYEAREVCVTVSLVAICTAVGIFGIVANAINMIVFYKQGFQNTMTISLMALAVSDMGCLITLQWFSVCMNPAIARIEGSFVPSEIYSLTAGWPNVTFGRITSWITAYITAERCLCITAPLAIKNIVTPKRTVFSLVVIYIINIISVVPVYVTSSIEWKYSPGKNRSYIGLTTTSDHDTVLGNVFLLHAVLFLTSFLCVIALTFLLVVKLKRASQWRHQATQGKAHSEAMSTKDKKASKMVAWISGLLIAMNSPGMLFSIATFFEPRFGLYGAYTNFYHTLWSFGFIFTAVNSSVNIIMYYNMSSKYRQVLNQMFMLSNLPS